VTAATRAAGCGAGILLEGMSGVDRLARLCEAFDAAGGTGSKVLIRRVWLGDVPAELVRRQRAVYDSYSNATAGFGDDQTIASTDPAEVAQRLAEVAEASGVDALNLRVQLPGMAPDAVGGQIEALGAEVLGRLKGLWPGHRP